MNGTRSRLRWFLCASLLAAPLASWFFLTAAPSEGKRITVYSHATSYSLPVTDHNGREYVGLLEILEPLGHVSTKGDARKWKVRFRDKESEFKQESSKARVRGHDVDLGAGVLFENGRGLVPLDSLSTLLYAFLDSPVLYHINSRRLFINQPGTTYSADLNRSTPPKLVLNFSGPVNPSISTEPGKLRMTFLKDPVVPSGPETTNFDNQAISSSTFQENNGAAELTVAGGVPLLASFSNNGRTITIVPAPSPTTAAAPSPQAPATTIGNPPPSSGTKPATSQAPPAPMRRIFAVLDASHGGEERGAVLTDRLVEKDVTLAFARRLREELQNRGIPALVIRDGDFTMTLDQRAVASNTARPALYIAIHATNSGAGVGVMSAALPTAPPSHPPLLSWEVAQSQWLPVSETAASSVATALHKRFSTRLFPAPLRPLNNVTSAAIAIEVGPQSAGANDLTSFEYQHAVAVAISDGMLAVRDKLEAAR